LTLREILGLEDISVIEMRGHVCGQGKPVVGGASPYAVVFEQTDGSQHRTYCALISSITGKLHQFPIYRQGTGPLYKSSVWSNANNFQSEKI